MKRRINRRSGAVATTILVALTAMAVVSAPAQASPTIDSSSYGFGSLQAGEAVIVGVLVSAQDEPTTIESVELSDPDSPFWIESEDCTTDGEMEIYDVCHIGLVFQAPDVDGDFQDTLTVRADDGDVAAASLRGTAYRAGGLVTEPGRVDWVGTAGARSVVLRNRTTDTLWIDSVVADSPFSVGPFRCSKELYPGSTCSISVRAPASDATGALMVRYANTYMSSPGQSTPILPFSTLSVPLTKSGRVRVSPWPISRPPAQPDYGYMWVDLGNMVAVVPRLLRGGPRKPTLLPRFKASMAGLMSLDLFRKKRGHRIRLGGGRLRFGTAGNGRMSFRLNKKGVTFLRRSNASRVTVVLKFTPPSGEVVRRAENILVKPPLKKRKRR